MPDIETRVRQLCQQYVAAFVNTGNLLRDDETQSKTYLHMLSWVSDRYRDTYKPSGLEWNMGECRAVKEFVVQVVGEIRRGT